MSEVLINPPTMIGMAKEWLDWHNPKKFELAAQQDDLLHETLDLGKDIGREEGIRYAGYDQLTGLPGRYLFVQELEKEIALIHRNNYHIGSQSIVGYAVIADADGLKRLNDEEGHDQGDELLKEIAYQFKTNLRSSDLVGRTGGDEFACLLPISQEGLQTIIEKMVKIKEKATVSIGIAPITLREINEMHQLKEDSLFSVFQRKPDEAMYLAKKHAKDTELPCIAYWEGDTSIKLVNLEKQIEHK
jgi:diguanylate cyclase (GGDEF)-like protein